jgi:predicted kinase
MNQKLIVMIGAPGSGKTTWAKQYLEEHKNDEFKWVRVSRDDIRMMCFNVEFDIANEVTVTQIEDKLVRLALEEGKNILIDATHVNRKSRNKWHKLALDVGGINVIEKGFKIDLETCLERNRNRDRKVPENIIQNMYEKLQKSGFEEWKETIYPEHIIETQVFNEKLPDAIICDLDGTVAENSWRNVYDIEKCEQDRPIYEIINLINIMSGCFIEDSEQRECLEEQILFVTGRKEQFREQTLNWLIKNVALTKHIYRDDIKLFMRQDGDNRPDTIVKKEIYEQYIKGKFNIDFVLDDRPSVCRMYRRLGLKVLQLNDIEF